MHVIYNYIYIYIYIKYICIFSLFKLGYNTIKATGYINRVYIHRKVTRKDNKTKINSMLYIQQLTLV